MSPDPPSSLVGFGGVRWRSEGPAFVELIDAPGGYLHAVHLMGSHHEMGRQYGKLLGDKILECWEVTKGIAASGGIDADHLETIGQRAWAHYAQHTPLPYLEEIDGVIAGATEGGFTVPRGVVETLAAFPEFTSYWRMEQIVTSLHVEAEPDVSPVWEGKERRPPRIHCSAFMAWGSRTEAGHLLGSRNLDWASDTGMAASKCVTVFHPHSDEGEPEVASAVFGYVGGIGAMAGMNAAGIVLSEVGAFNACETLDGRPWHYVFREVLDRANDLDEAVDYFDRGNYTQGYNFLAGWGDPAGVGGPAFAPSGAAIEVDAAHIEILRNGDPREAGAVWIDGEERPVLVDGRTVPYGLPVSDAVVRADTAFAPTIRKSQATDNGPAGDGNSGDPREGDTWQTLYLPITQMIEAVTDGRAFDTPGKESWHFSASAPRRLDRTESLHVCVMSGDNDDNVMSVVYDATALTAEVAFETGSGPSWRAAARTAFIGLDLGPVLRGTGPSGLPQLHVSPESLTGNDLRSG